MLPFFLLCCCLNLSVENEVVADPVPQAVCESRELFNGVDLENWYIFLRGRELNDDPNNVFTVVDGAIRISGQELGCITTNEAFRDYRIIIEWKWGEKTWGNRVNCTRDSGLLIHSIGKDGAFHEVWMNSLEVNIIEGGTGDFIVVGDGSDDFSISAPVAPQRSNADCSVYQQGSDRTATINAGRIDWFNRAPNWEDTINFRGANDVENPRGQWNHLEVIAGDNTIDVWLNGVLVNQAFDIRPTGGRIQLQSELAEIFIRRITLQPLNK